MPPPSRRSQPQYESDADNYDSGDVLRRELLGDYQIWKADGKPKCYERTVSIMVDKVDSGEWSPSSDAIDTLSAVMSFHHDTVNALANSYQYRDHLMKASSVFTREDQRLISTALIVDEHEIFEWFWDIVASKKNQVLSLHGKDAENIISLTQTILDKHPSQVPGRNTRQCRSDALQLLVRLAQTCNILPSSLFIKGVELLDWNSSFSGGFGDIFRAVYCGKAVALKRIRAPTGAHSQQAFRMLCREILVWKQLKHPFILPFLGIDSETFKPEGKGSAFVSRVLFRAQRHMCLVSPWMVHGTVLDYTKSVEVEKVTIDRLSFEIAQGIEYIHSLNLVHGDLRCSNILVDDECHARIADFGLAYILPTTVSHSKDNLGSWRWMAPELHHPEGFGLDCFLRTRETDVFAFACTCLELYTGRPPFYRIPNDGTVILEYIQGKRPKKPSRKPLSDDIWNLIQCCWTQQPQDRPSMKTAVDNMREF